MTTVPKKIRWEQPPPARRTGRPSLIAAVVEELKAHPGQWAKVHSGRPHPSNRQQIQFKRRGCEAITRKLDDGHALYVRWPA